MLDRSLGSTITISLTAAAASTFLLSFAMAQAPAKSDPAQNSTVKTPWGEPDLQGIWTDETDTSLQRPAKYANQEFFTTAQQEELDQERYGDSRGHWEGNTLVVDVTNFSAKTDYQGSRENLHLIERWTRTSPTSIEYVATIEDPTVWTRPWTVKQEFMAERGSEQVLHRAALRRRKLRSSRLDARSARRRNRI
jgi:hypothetical protein